MNGIPPSMSLWKAPGDGSCFFHSVGRSIGLQATEVRSLCVAQLVARADEVMSDLPLSRWVELETGMSFARYVRAMKAHHWGGAVEMKLLADVLGRPIVVYGDQKGTVAQRLTIVEPMPGTCTIQRPVCLLYTHGMHYDALLS